MRTVKDVKDKNHIKVRSEQHKIGVEKHVFANGCDLSHFVHILPLIVSQCLTLNFHSFNSIEFRVGFTC